ncbi:MAG UNVERIFIED_CONTAM: hypothetical protein LVR18_07465 [Planctomycetaceae bacterium]
MAWLIRRPTGQADDLEGQPDWLRKLRSLFSGIYTVDNMDFVLRDAYMSGYNTKAFDISRLIHYSFFTENGLTIHARGLPTLINFIETRANLFRTIYFHRTVRGIDIALEDHFTQTMKRLFPGNPLDHLAAYQGLTETSFLIDVSRWASSSDPTLQRTGTPLEGHLQPRGNVAHGLRTLHALPQRPGRKHNNLFRTRPRRTPRSRCSPQTTPRDPAPYRRCSTLPPPQCPQADRQTKLLVRPRQRPLTCPRRRRTLQKSAHQLSHLSHLQPRSQI